MIKIKDLQKSWKDFSLKNINLEVKNKEYLVILGPTGAGKTLLLEMIVGFHSPDSGEIWINGENVTDSPPEKRKVGFVYQDYMLFPHMTVRENVEFGLKMHGIPPVERKKAANDVLELTGLMRLRDRFPNTLSGGEQQKTALARALIIKPKVLLLDEPLSALDVSTQKRLRGELKRLHEELRITTVHVTHDQVEAFVLADRLAVMRDGAIVQTGSPEEVFHKPRDDYVARFVGFENLFDGEVVENQKNVAKIDIGGVIIEAVTEKVGKCVVGVRPDDIIVSKRLFKSSVRNTLKGAITDFVDMDAFASLIVSVGNSSFAALITKRSFLEMRLKKGSEVYLSFKASAVHVI